MSLALDDEDRAVGVVRHGEGHPAEQQRVEGAEASGTHHDEVGPPHMSVTDDLVARHTLENR